MEYFEEIQDRVILIGVQANLGDDMEESLDELEELGYGRCGGCRQDHSES